MFARIAQFIHCQVSDVANPIATSIAQRSAVEIRERLGTVACEMSPAEARGYVRARGRRIVNLQARLVGIEQGGLPRAILEQARSTALQKVVHEVVREVLSKPSTRFSRRAA